MDKEKRLSISIAALIALCLCLCITSFALGMAVYEVKNNSFQTGGIEIDLNDGKPIITAEEFLFEPGMTVEKPFYIQNNGTWAVYYKLYFSQVSGNLGDVLDVTILDEEGTELLSGKLSALTEKNVPAVENELTIGERQNLVVRFHFPEEEGNAYQGGSLRFELSAIAVQTKNNPDKEFDE